MPITGADTTLAKTVSTPSSDVASTVDGTMGAEISSGLGELVPMFVYNPLGGALITWFLKFFFKNKHATLTLTDLKFYLKNGLIPSVADSTWSAVSDHVDDDSDYRVRGYFKDSFGNEIFETLTMNGTTPVNSSSTVVAGTFKKAEFTNASGALTNTTGNVTLTAGLVMGKIPVACDFATGEIAFALETSTGTSTVIKNGTVGPTNRLTDPTDNRTAWSTINNEAGALAGVDLAPSDGQGVFVRLEGRAGTTPSNLNRLRIGVVAITPA